MSVKGTHNPASSLHAGDGSSTPDRRRVRNPQGQGGRLRAELIAAADGILARTGDGEGLSLRAVAREVGIATPSIYLHFPDKSALIQAVLTVRFAELGDAVQTAIEQATGPDDRLRAGCLAYCRFAIENPNAYRVLFGRMSRPGPNGGFEVGADAFNVLVEGVAASMRAGIARDGDPFRMATNVWTALHGIVSLRSATPKFPWPSLERQVDDVLEGLVGVHHNPPPTEG